MDEQSRNSWINKDEPSDVSSMAKYKDKYEDILEDRRLNSDWKYCFKNRSDEPRYKYSKPRTPAEIKEHVLQSDRVKYRVEVMSTELGISTTKLMEEAKSILDEMAHNLSLPAIRGFAFILIKVFKSLFRRVYVNEEGVQRMRRLAQEYPVLLMPSHRSYMDFLLVSYVFYDYNLPLPVIAAAMDFKGMKFFGWLLRNSGAFYIRRSFGTDKLYWAVFTEYVQTQLRNGDSPVEFFVEGTRSRTAKSYIPKIGMLSAALESYFKAEVPDIMIVPISISYERILEESLYAYELLGVPKPKESASGVLKARSILSEDFGSVHFNIDEPISIRQFSAYKIDRVIHAKEPRYINNLTSEEQELMQHLAFAIVRRQQHNMVISPWALMACVLMQSKEGISTKLLVKETDWLKGLAYNLGAYVDWPGNTSSESVIEHYLRLHSNVVSSNGDFVELKTEKPSRVKKPLQSNVMLHAATNMIIASHRNQVLHVFVRTAMVALSINGCANETMSMDELFQRYAYLEKVFSRDFVFQPGETKQDFDEAVLTLTHSRAMTLQDNVVCIKKSINKHTTFLSQMFEPFLMAYWVLCQHLLSLDDVVHGRPLAVPQKQICKDAQKLAIRLLQEGVLTHYEVLSLDLLANGLNMLNDMGTLYRDKRNEQPYCSPNTLAVSQVADEIAKYIETPTESISSYVTKKETVVISAKL